MAFNEQPRTYAAAHFALELDGKRDVGLFKSIEGGGVKADVMTYQNGANYERWRSLGKQKYEDLKLQVGMAMSPPFYQWIEQFFTGKGERKNGAIVAADFYYNERARREFTEALIKELTFPKLDGSDPGAVYMSIGVAVEDLVFKKGGGQKLPQSPGTDQQKLWYANNFRFRLDGYDQACRRTSKVDSFTIKQNIIEHHVGGRQSPIKTPSQIDFPSLSFYVPEADAQPFFDHHTRRAMQSNREQKPSGGQTGMLEVFDHEGKTLFTLEFYGAEIFNVAPERSDAKSEEIKLVKVEVWTESMKFSYGGGPRV
ncbi:MAG TPA: phage tail protein [Kofleriaceae bacterium]|jgi:phage tail-like protein|nr:phage tail protein [Kofleriaceae bacterium]